MTRVDFVVPAGVADPRRPSGGNHYDLRVTDGLSRLGWGIELVEVPGAWPSPRSVDALRQRLSRIPSGALVLLDGLIASGAGDEVAALAARCRVVLLVHGVVGLATEPIALRAAHLVVTTSRWTAGRVQSITGRECAVAVPGVEAAPETAPSASGGRLLSVGAVTPTKGQDVVLAALDEVQDLAWEWRCVGALDIDRDFARGLVERSRAFSRPISWTGPLPWNEVVAAYATADLVVVGSRIESYGMVIAEALAHGVPVLATDVGGVHEAMGRPVPGRLVPVEDPAALAAALRAWLTSPEERDDWRRAARLRRGNLPGWQETVAVVAQALTTARQLSGAPT